MFQVEPILWLQQFATPEVTLFLAGVSSLGLTRSYAAIVLALAFGVRLRPALGLLLVLLLTANAVNTLKRGFGLPRPSDVDARVIEPGSAPIAPRVDGGGGRSLWDPPSSEARAAMRNAWTSEFGFPSGHTGSAAAFVLGLVGCFGWRHRWVWLAAVAWPALMAVSRLYLGRHFVGDVLGGWALGALGAAAGVLLHRRLLEESPAGEREDGPRRAPVAHRLALAGSIAWFAAIPWSPAIEPENAGRLLGFFAAWTWLARVGWPRDSRGLAARALRVAASFAVYGLAERAGRATIGGLGSGSDSMLVASVSAAVLSLTLVAGTAIARRLAAWPPGPGDRRAAP